MEFLLKQQQQQKIKNQKRMHTQKMKYCLILRPIVCVYSDCFSAFVIQFVPSGLEQTFQGF